MNFDPDLAFVIGIVFGLLAVPALISAFSEGRTPRAAAVLIMISVGMIAYAVIQRPTGYSLGEAPEIFMQVIGRLVN